MKYNHTYSILLAGIALLTLPTLAAAQSFQPLVGIPGMGTGPMTMADYLNSLYILAISLAAIFAVVKIILGGVKYMFTDIVTQKGDAKKDIQGALFGLLIVLAAALVLETINPQITQVMTFDPAADGVNIEGRAHQRAVENLREEYDRVIPLECDKIGRDGDFFRFDCTVAKNSCERISGEAVYPSAFGDMRHDSLIYCGTEAAAYTSTDACTTEEECSDLVQACIDKAKDIGGYPAVDRVSGPVRDTVHCSVQAIETGKTVTYEETESDCSGTYESSTGACVADNSAERIVREYVKPPSEETYADYDDLVENGELRGFGIRTREDFEEKVVGVGVVSEIETLTSEGNVREDEIRKQCQNKYGEDTTAYVGAISSYRVLCIQQ